MRNKRHARLEVKWINPAKLVIDNAYQRGFRQAWGDTIVAEFDENQVRPLDVVDRGDGSYAVENGQHTLYALTVKGWQTVPCFVRNGATTVADEAEHFIKGNSNSKSLTQIELFNAAITAGRQKQIAIRDVLARHGLVVSNNGGSRNAIRAVRALEKVYDVSGPEGLDDVLRITTSVWTEEETSRFSAHVLVGLGFFLNNNPKTSEEKLVAKLRTIDPVSLLRRAKTSMRGMGSNSMAPAVALVIGEVYRKRGRGDA